MWSREKERDAVRKWPGPQICWFPRAAFLLVLLAFHPGLTQTSWGQLHTEPKWGVNLRLFLFPSCLVWSDPCWYRQLPLPGSRCSLHFLCAHTARECVLLFALSMCTLTAHSLQTHRIRFHPWDTLLSQTCTSHSPDTSVSSISLIKCCWSPCDVLLLRPAFFSW